MRAIYRKTVLPNGVRLISEELSQVRSVAVGFWVGAGSRHEGEDESGITHFIEHLLFKGTETRSARQIAETMDAVGGHLNAFTGRECTCFYARVLDEHFSLAVDLLADMVLHPRFGAEDIEKEKKVILEEIMMYEDAPDELVHDIFTHSLWPGHPLGRAVQGTLDSVRAISRDAILDYYQRHYIPGNVVVAVAGHIPHEQAAEEMARRFNGHRPAEAPGMVPASAPLAQGRTFRDKNIEQVHICLGGEGLPLGDERAYTLHLLNNILGGGASSRLFQEIREERGLAYSVYAFQNAYRDTGLAGIYLAASPVAAADALVLARAELERISQHGVSQEELERNKEQLKASLVLGLESTSNRMNHLGKGEMLLGRVLSPDDIVARVESVQVEDIRDLSGRIWHAGRLGVAAVGPAAAASVVEA